MNLILRFIPQFDLMLPPSAVLTAVESISRGITLCVYSAELGLECLRRWQKDLSRAARSSKFGMIKVI